jgi:hypothetical protein
VERASRRSRYVKRAAECIEALDQLRAEYPDESRRPFGEKALLAELAFPFFGYSGIERVIAKIHARKWTAHDEAKMEGRPLPEPKD